MEILTSCLDPAYELQEGDIAQLIEQLIISLTNQEPELSHIQLVADLAKKESFREKADQLIKPLLNILKKDTVTREVIQQIMRGVGNLGFYHNPSKDQILQHSGAKCIVKHFTDEVNTNNNMPDNTLIRVMCLVVTNISCEHNDLGIDLMTEGVLLPVSTVIKESKDHDSIMAAIGALRMLIECGRACQEHFMVAKLPDILVARLGEVGMQEVIDKLLEFLKELIETEDLNELKSEMVRAKIGRPLCLIGKWNTVKETRQAALEMLGMLATEDECMKLLYSDDVITSSLFDWLDSHDISVKCSALFLAVNFARNEENCISLMSRGLQDILVNVLTEAGDDPQGIKIGYVSWSILRNLAVSHKNKDELCDKFLPALASRYLSSKNESIVFKVLSALRSLLTKSSRTCHVFLTAGIDMLSVIIEMECHSIEHIQSESSRLIATLVKGSTGHTEGLSNIWTHGGVKSLIFLIQAKHDVMKNEGLLALYVLANELPSLKDEMCQRGVDDILWDCLSNQASAEECMIAEYISNMIMLVCKIGMRDITDERLICLKKIGLRHSDNEQIQTLVNSVLK
ncbi:Rap1 GTPase-GDP dissociation stimulator 1 [Oopsacas minuta]|uniref:Rap1 GTPase-GDP dissociation stimulator 1 n=1 Tax=Oopsacas minuta TaxID=111878 RepID=A0AAV7KDH3_9METZ|nr:Rap1 GTPase-GDP dissociation stimulator 1 [Oopsacas minuta]